MTPGLLKSTDASDVALDDEGLLNNIAPVFSNCVSNASD